MKKQTPFLTIAFSLFAVGFSSCHSVQLNNIQKTLSILQENQAVESAKHLQRFNDIQKALSILQSQMDSLTIYKKQNQCSDFGKVEKEQLVNGKNISLLETQVTNIQSSIEAFRQDVKKDCTGHKFGCDHDKKEFYQRGNKLLHLFQEINERFFETKNFVDFLCLCSKNDCIEEHIKLSRMQGELRKTSIIFFEAITAPACNEWSSLFTDIYISKEHLLKELHLENSDVSHVKFGRGCIKLYSPK